MTPHTIDDFAEFYLDAYRPLIEAINGTGRAVTVEAGAIGHYLLVARNPHADLGCTVEITADGGPIPSDPDDVTTWVLATPTGSRHVAASEGLRVLTEAVQALQHP